jgi:hypothetical protein
MELPCYTLTMTETNEILPMREDNAAWRNESLDPNEGQVTLSDACLREIVELSQILADNPLPTTCLNPTEFDLPHCRDAMAQARSELEDGPGFVIIDRLPLQEMPQGIGLGVYWLLLSLIGRAVAQSWDGKMLYGVADTSGKPPGNGIRADVTNAEQNFHTDNSYNLCPPDYVVLLCMQTAKAGGISRVASLQTAHNLLQARQPDLLERLYQPFYFDRQREHAPGDVQYIQRPVFHNSGGRLTARLSGQLIRQGYELSGEKLDQRGEAALSALYSLLNDPALYKEFYFEPGQIQIVNNRFLAHKRTKFEDWPEQARKRHLVRLWLRQEGRLFYNG